MADAKEIAMRNRRRARALMRNLKKAIEVSEVAIWKEAVKNSEGTTSTAALSAAPPGLNHPYGIGMANRRGARGSIPNGGDPGIINQQKGTFKASWDTKATVRTDAQMIVLFNDSKEAKFMMGTSKMRPRPILVNIHKTQDKPFTMRLAEAKRKALQTQ